MSRVTSVTVTGVSASNAIPLNHYANPFSVGFAVVVVGTSAPTYTVQHTFHDVLGGATATWFDHSFVSGQTANRDGNYAFPVMAVRLNSTVSGDGATPSATLHVIQAGC